MTDKQIRKVLRFLEKNYDWHLGDGENEIKIAVRHLRKALEYVNGRA